MCIYNIILSQIPTYNNFYGAKYVHLFLLCNAYNKQKKFPDIIRFGISYAAVYKTNIAKK